MCQKVKRTCRGIVFDCSLHLFSSIQSSTFWAGLFKSGLANPGLVLILNSVLKLSDVDLCKFVLPYILTLAPFEL